MSISPMGSGPGATAVPDDRPFFVFTLWVALVTAILCALWPAGLPLTTSIGSAFSPSTTAVALRARAEQLRPPVKRVVKTGPEALDSPVPLASPPAMLIRFPSVARGPVADPGDPVFPVEPFPAPANPPANAFYPRGPPTA